jgi:DNA-binding GntR family transcriptional regulator
MRPATNATLVPTEFAASTPSRLDRVPASTHAQGLPHFEAVVSRTRREQVVDLLREAILSGQLVRGSQLVEMKIATRLGVSRGSLREAIRELVEQGLLVSKPYAGTFVATIAESAMAELFDLRRVLERHAFCLVWPRRSAEYRRSFVERHDALLAAAASGVVAAEVRAEMHFQSTSYEFSGNAMLLETWQMLVGRIQLGFLIAQTVDRPRAVKLANERYLRCALGDDLDAMLQELDRHIDLGLRRVRRFMQTREPAAETAAPA